MERYVTTYLHICAQGGYETTTYPEYTIDEI